MIEALTVRSEAVSGKPVPRMAESIALHEQLMRSPITQQQLQPSRAVAPSTAPLVQRNITVNIPGDVYGIDDLDRRVHRGVREAMQGG